MQASKVTISQETRQKLANPVLDRKKRKELRELLIKEAILSRRSSKFSKQELIAFAGLDPTTGCNEYTNGLTLINSMIKRGLISHNKTEQIVKKWKVKGATPVATTPEAEVGKLIVHKEPVVELQEYQKLDYVSLEQMAREYSWVDNSDSLRGFMAYIKNAVK